MSVQPADFCYFGIYSTMPASVHGKSSGLSVSCNTIPVYPSVSVYPCVCSTLCLCTQSSSSTISVFAVMPATLLHTVNRLVFQYCNTIFVDLFFWYFSMCSILCLCTELSSAISLNVVLCLSAYTVNLLVFQYCNTVHVYSLFLVFQCLSVYP